MSDIYSDFQFKGKHANYVTMLTTSFDSQRTDFKVFKRNIDVLIFAPIVGVLYNRKAEVDNDNTYEPKKINYQQMSKESIILEYNYQLVMLLNKKNEINFDERISKAFKNLYDENKSKERAEDQKEYMRYVLGGIEVLYEKIMQNAKTADDYVNNMYSFINEIQNRYNETLDRDLLYDMCNKVQNNQKSNTY